MTANLIKNNSNNVNVLHALRYLNYFIKEKVKAYLESKEKGEDVVLEIETPQYSKDNSAFSSFIANEIKSVEEYIILALALAPHIQPNYLEKIIRESLPGSGEFPEIGGIKDDAGRYFLPTGETILFLLAGEDFDKRFEVQQILTGDHWFSQKGVLHLEPAKEGQPFFSGRLVMSQDYIELFTLGKISTPSFSQSFPAQEITTEMDWGDLVLEASTLEQIEELKSWVQHNDTLLHHWQMSKKIKPGYRALFHGPPGTGKTLTASLLGKYTGRKVFRVDLSTVVSKYIGETEKNLSSLFDKAKNKNWILFFDEADALFGKRTSVKDAHDRYANQEVSYLLQRVEDFDGLVILASNFKANMDEAFLRRFNAIIKFPFPNSAERLAIWKKSFPENVAFEKRIDLEQIAAKYEIAGGNIINVVHFACLKAIARDSNLIMANDILLGIRREIEKEGKLFKGL